MDNSNLSNCPLWTADHLRPADITQVRRLFSEVFQQPMSQALWDWKYGDNRGHNVVVKRANLIVAHYGGIKRDVIWGNTVTPSIQCVDTMVAITDRGTLKKKGPYYLATEHFLNQYVGYHRPYLFGFGFPNQRVMKLGEILGVQSPVGTLVEPVWKPKKAVRLLSEIAPDSNYFDEHLDRLWDEMKNKFPENIVCVRDRSTILHRYIHHPEYQYLVRIVHHQGETCPMGAYVLRSEDDSVLLLDLIGDPAFFPQLIDQALHTACQLGHELMSTWITEPHIHMLGQRHHKINPIHVKIPTSICTPGPQPASLIDKWWLMAGDTDFK